MNRYCFEEDHQLFREAYRRFLEQEVLPHRESWRENNIVPKDMFKKMGDQGYLLCWAPEEYGGLGLKDFRYQQIMMEEDAVRGEVGFFHTLHSRLVGPYIEKFGSDEQKQRYLPSCISGETVLAIAMTEPDAGSDLAGMKTRAVDCGDHWLLNGAKTYISNGINADLVIVAAKTNPDKPRQIGLFLVDAAQAGFARGRNLKKLGLKAQDTAELFFTDIKLPKSAALGDPDKGMHYLMHSLAEERLIAACDSLAAARRAFDVTKLFVIERKVFGQSLAQLQNTRFKMAQLFSEINIAQCFIDHCVAEHNAGKLTSEMAAQAKLISSELQGRACDEGVQLHGGAGYMMEYEICELYANARVSRILAGSAEIMKEIIARSVFDTK